MKLQTEVSLDNINFLSEFSIFLLNPVVHPLVNLLELTVVRRSG